MGFLHQGSAGLTLKSAAHLTGKQSLQSIVPWLRSTHIAGVSNFAQNGVFALTAVRCCSAHAESGVTAPLASVGLLGLGARVRPVRRRFKMVRRAGIGAELGVAPIIYRFRDGARFVAVLGSSYW